MWKFHGTREQWADMLVDVTHIDLSLLRRQNPHWIPRLWRLSIADRMSWAANRQTTRPEDIAYCLFGIFNVHLPPLYGEGAANAFLRLQEEIMRTSMDLSILAWTGKSCSISRGVSALAHSPTCFNGNMSISFADDDHEEPFKMTNKGLHIKIPLIQIDGDGGACTAILRNCRYRDGSLIGVRLLSPAPVWTTRSPITMRDGLWYRCNNPTARRDSGIPVVHSVDKGAIENAEIHKIHINVRTKN
jgi:hypothetical protein